MPVDYMNLTPGEAQVKRDTEAAMQEKLNECAETVGGLVDENESLKTKAAQWDQLEADCEGLADNETLVEDVIQRSHAHDTLIRILLWLVDKHGTSLSVIARGHDWEEAWIEAKAEIAEARKFVKAAKKDTKP